MDEAGDRGDDGRFVRVFAPGGGGGQGRGVGLDQFAVHVMAQHDDVGHALHRDVVFFDAFRGRDAGGVGVDPALVVLGDTEQIGAEEFADLFDAGRGFLDRGQFGLAFGLGHEAVETIEKTFAFAGRQAARRVIAGHRPGGIEQGEIPLRIAVALARVGALLGRVEGDHVVADDRLVPPGAIENIVALFEAAKIVADHEAGFGIALGEAGPVLRRRVGGPVVGLPVICGLAGRCVGHGRPRLILTVPGMITRDKISANGASAEKFTRCQNSITRLSNKRSVE